MAGNFNPFMRQFGSASESRAFTPTTTSPTNFANPPALAAPAAAPVEGPAELTIDPQLQAALDQMTAQNELFATQSADIFGAFKSAGADSNFEADIGRLANQLVPFLEKTQQSQFNEFFRPGGQAEGAIRGHFGPQISQGFAPGVQNAIQNTLSGGIDRFGDIFGQNALQLASTVAPVAAAEVGARGQRFGALANLTGTFAGVGQQGSADFFSGTASGLDLARQRESDFFNQGISREQLDEQFRLNELSEEFARQDREFAERELAERSRLAELDIENRGGGNIFGDILGSVVGTALGSFVPFAGPALGKLISGAFSGGGGGGSGGRTGVGGFGG